MEHKIPCEMVQDLLPLFIDELTSEETNKEINKHIEECDECKKHYYNLKQTILWEKEKELKNAGKEINYLKKIRRNNNNRLFLGILSALLIIIALVGAKFYIIGYPVDSYELTYINADENQVSFGGIFFNPSDTYKGYKIKIEDNGRKEVILYARKKSLWSQDNVFNLNINLNDIKAELNIKGNTINPGGTVITKLANDLYNAKNQYIGNMSSNGKIASILEIAKTVGNFKNSLETTKEPYGWTLEFQKSISNSAIFEEKMKNFSCVLIALIGNLGEVSWTYTVETEDASIERNNTITEEECTKYVGKPIKTFSESPENMQRLLDFLSIRN